MKKFLLLFTLLLLTGCSIKYNLKIDDKFTENIEVSGYTMGSDDNELKMNLSTGFPLYYDNSSSSSIIPKYEVSTGDNYEFLKLKGVFPSLNNNSNAVLSVCDNYIVSKDNKIISLNASGFKIFESYYDMDELTINITTDYEVISNNADSVNKNVYTWVINEDNYNDKLVSIELKTGNIIKDNYLIILLIIIILALTIFIYVFYNMIKKKNIESNEL